MYTKHDRDNAKLRPQRRRIQPNFIKLKYKNLNTYQTTKHKNTTRTPKTTISMWVLLLTQSLCSCNWDTRNSGVFIFKLCSKSTNFVHFIHHQFFALHLSPKTCTWLAEQFCTFHPSLPESVPTWIPTAKFFTPINLFDYVRQHLIQYSRKIEINEMIKNILKR